jgi:hypothetical protein
VVWCGVVWCGVVWCGVVWCGVVWCGVVWCGGGGVWWCGMCGVVLVVLYVIVHNVAVEAKIMGDACLVACPGATIRLFEVRCSNALLTTAPNLLLSMTATPN